MILALATRLEQALVRLSRLCAALAASSLFLIVGIIVASVVMRRLAGSPMYYTEELVGLLRSTSLFLALPMVTVQSSHVRVTFLANFLPQLLPFVKDPAFKLDPEKYVAELLRNNRFSPE